MKVQDTISKQMSISKGLWGPRFKGSKSSKLAAARKTGMWTGTAPHLAAAVEGVCPVLHIWFPRETKQCWQLLLAFLPANLDFTGGISFSGKLDGDSAVSEGQRRHQIWFVNIPHSRHPPIPNKAHALQSAWSMAMELLCFRVQRKASCWIKHNQSWYCQMLLGS